MSPEDVRDQWEKVCDFTDSTRPTSMGGESFSGEKHKKNHVHECPMNICVMYISGSTGPTVYRIYSSDVRQNN